MCGRIEDNGAWITHDNSVKDQTMQIADVFNYTQVSGVEVTDGKGIKYAN